MSTPKVPRGTVVPLRPRSRPAERLTLADVTITWSAGTTKRTATGRQIARLLTMASEKAPSGLFAQGRDAGQAVPMLRGLADLIFPDARERDFLDEDTRYFVTETLERLAAQIAGDELDSEAWPERFTVHVKRGAGKHATATRPTAPANGRGAR